MKLTFYADQACTKVDPAGLFWRGVKCVEVGTDSAIVEAGWARWRAAWGGSTFRLVAWDETRPLGEADLRKDWWAIPAQTRSFTAEGKRDHAGVAIDVTLLLKAK